MYAYVRNNPIKLVDPFGLQTPEQRITSAYVTTMIGMIIVGGVEAIAIVTGSPIIAAVGVVVGAGIVVLGGLEAFYSGQAVMNEHFRNYENTLNELEPGAGTIFGTRNCPLR